MQRRWFVPLLLLLAGVAAPAAAEEPARRTGWTYHLQVAPGLKQARVRMCFQGYLPKRLILSRTEALAAIRLLPDAQGRVRFRSNPARNGILPMGLRDGSCLTYDIDLDQLAQISRLNRETWRVGRDLITRSGLTLLHPAKWPETADVTLTVELPTGYRLAAPWPEANGRYRLSKWTPILNSRFAIGRWTPQRVTVAGGQIDVALLDGPHRITRAGIDRWLQVAGGAAADLYDGFPVSRMTLLVHPILPGRPRPVISGRTCLAGGPHAHVMLSGNTRDELMPGEYLTIHEFVHLGLPWTEDPDRWFQEGFAAYYQTVLRTRMGALTEQAGWQRLHDWFEQGRKSGGKRTLAAETPLMTVRYAYHRVYWGGAAMALLMDTEIRRRWPGRRSLDDVVRHLHGLQREGRVFTGLEVMAAIDQYLGEPVCEPIARRWLASRAFPDVAPAYRALGLQVQRGRIVYADDAPQIRDRTGIMRRGGR